MVAEVEAEAAPGLRLRFPKVYHALGHGWVALLPGALSWCLGQQNAFGSFIAAGWVHCNMVVIAPFRAVRFNSHQIKLTTATSPPHDCIVPGQRDEFLNAEPRNIVQVILGPQGPARINAENWRIQARDALLGWLADGTMRRDTHPALYYYVISYGSPKNRKAMSGVFARLRLDPTYTEVRPHEKILRSKKGDRLELRQTTGFDCEPIWMLYRDQNGRVEELLVLNAFEELAHFTDEEGHEHWLWRIDRPEALTKIVEYFLNQKIVIADGHHRYQAALDHQAATGRDEDGSILVCLVRDNDPGARIEATHRLVHALPFTPSEALRRASVHWEVAPLELEGHGLQDLLASLQPGGLDLISVHLDDGKLKVHQLTLRPRSELKEGRGRLDGLVVTRVHERLLRDSWGLDPEHAEEHLHFIHDADVAVAAVRSRTADLALLLPPETVESVLEVASQGHFMPPKATYFVPKLRSGLVLAPLDEPRV